MVSIFSRTSGADQITYWDKGKPIDSESYINDCPNPLLSSLYHGKKHFGIKNIKFQQENALPNCSKCHRVSRRAGVDYDETTTVFSRLSTFRFLVIRLD